MDNQLTIFEQKPIRRVELEGVIYFSIVDIIEILTESTAPSKYWDAVKRREPQLSTICRKLKILSLDGKKRPSDCANTDSCIAVHLKKMEHRVFNSKNQVTFLPPTAQSCF
jgi:DNA-damage-inducible protein D